MANNLHACGIVVENGKILLTRRALNDYSEPGKWCPINETIEPGESAEQAVVRGAIEEVGIIFKIISQFKPTTFINNSTVVFIGKRTGKISIQIEEVAEYNWFNFEKACKLDLAYDYSDLIHDLHTQRLF